ncbi:hypothetical protein QFC20_001697 [Naganishia adeliensis]|uniref:Uncharacterized protein n=1 Tax=Naganishia adeliensis TaxID=92952 RepID=A0ACC2WSV3_9TREE|nr:hypothetical protein QFC20_001697 [Naganishia adeliensis]
MSSARQSCTRCARQVRQSPLASTRGFSNSARTLSADAPAYASANLSDPKRPAFASSSTPGRLSPSDLRKLVELHHQSSSFITQQNLSSSIHAAFRAGDQLNESDFAFRKLAAARLELREGAGKSDRLVRHGASLDSAGQERSDATGSIVFGYDPEPVTAVDIANRLQENELWSAQKEDRADHHSSRDLVGMREGMMRDALYGTVGKKAMPGLEAVLDHVEENSK